MINHLNIVDLFQTCKIFGVGLHDRVDSILEFDTQQNAISKVDKYLKLFYHNDIQFIYDKKDLTIEMIIINFAYLEETFFYFEQGRKRVYLNERSSLSEFVLALNQSGVSYNINDSNTFEDQISIVVNKYCGILFVIEDKALIIDRIVICDLYR